MQWVVNLTLLKPTVFCARLYPPNVQKSRGGVLPCTVFSRMYKYTIQTFDHLGLKACDPRFRPDLKHFLVSNVFVSCHQELARRQKSQNSISLSLLTLTMARRRLTNSQKLRIVADANQHLQLGESLKSIACSYDIQPVQIQK